MLKNIKFVTLHVKVHFHPTCRALQFIIIFLKEVLTGEQDLVKCAKKAYEGSLKKYHGWIVQGIFSVSIFISICCQLFPRI